MSLVMPWATLQALPWSYRRGPVGALPVPFGRKDSLAPGRARTAFPELGFPELDLPTPERGGIDFAKAGLSAQAPVPVPVPVAAFAKLGLRSIKVAPLVGPAR